MSNDEIKNTLLRWYDVNKRDLPWRLTKDPYHIWVSEVILQQTRVVQGIDYYRRFIEHFPDVKALAKASDDEVMLCWQGLGYYRRALHLHQAARYIVEHCDAVFPTTYTAVMALKGVGSYTAAAICSMAYGLPYAAVDGNVYRVLSRLFGVDIPIDSGRGQRYFQELAFALLDKEQAGEYNQAMMDFGTLQCTPQSPDCESCPFRKRCVAFLNGNANRYPVKEKKTKIRNRYLNYIRISSGGKTIIKKRQGKDIWHNLYEFPLIERDHEINYQDLIMTNEFSMMAKNISWIHLKSTLKMPKHQLSHQSIYATFYEMEWGTLPQMEGTIVVAESELGHYAMSQLIENYFTLLK